MEQEQVFDQENNNIENVVASSLVCELPNLNKGDQIFTGEYSTNVSYSEKEANIIISYELNNKSIDENELGCLLGKLKDKHTTKGRLDKNIMDQKGSAEYEEIEEDDRNFFYKLKIGEKKREKTLTEVYLSGLFKVVKDSVFNIFSLASDLIKEVVVNVFPEFISSLLNKIISTIVEIFSIILDVLIIFVPLQIATIIPIIIIITFLI